MGLSPGLRRWTIDRTWDGAPARPEEIAVVTAAPADGGLEIRVQATAHGDPPPAAPPGRLSRLWEHEVVELFLLGSGERYLELELGPHGHYLALQLHGPRRTVVDDLVLGYRATRGGSRWHGRVHLPASLLPDNLARANACAIHGRGPARRWLVAAPLGGERPDFHRIDRYPELPLPESPESPGSPEPPGSS